MTGRSVARVSYLECGSRVLAVILRTSKRGEASNPLCDTNQINTTRKGSSLKITRHSHPGSPSNKTKGKKNHLSSLLFGSNAYNCSVSSSSSGQRNDLFIQVEHLSTHGRRQLP